MEQTQKENISVARYFLLLLYFFVLLRNAWVAEDAYIMLRTVDNFIHGYGMRWNTIERVQCFTNPLWFFLVSFFYFITRNIYFSALFPGIVCSIFAVWILAFKVIKDDMLAILALTIVIFSKAFVDYSTSGLENPLTHLLLILFYYKYSKAAKKGFTECASQTLVTIFLLAGLLTLNRMDTILFCLFPVAHIVISLRFSREMIKKLLIGFSPFIVWEIFSLFYYGFLFPNNAYAKLNTGIPPTLMIQQGLYYYINSLSWDPLTLLITVFLILFACIGKQTQKHLTLISLSILLYLLYTIRVGGDYMSGRFLTAVFFGAMILLSELRIETTLEKIVLFSAIIALGFSSPRPPLLSSDSYKGLGSSVQAVDDERGYRHLDTAFLLLNKNHSLINQSGWVEDGLKARSNNERVTIYRNIGYFGYFAGPNVHVIDPYGLSDPLLARLKPKKDEGWSTGHFIRDFPAGYEKAVLGDSVIENPDIQNYFEKLKIITRGDLFSFNRFKEIIYFNFGDYDHWIKK